MGDGIACIFDTICCNDSKWYPILIIGRLILYGIKEYRHSVGLGY